MYTGVVELRKTKIVLSSSLTNQGSIPEWCERLMTKLWMGGVEMGASECSELLEALQRKQICGPMVDHVSP